MKTNETNDGDKPRTARPEPPPPPRTSVFADNYANRSCADCACRDRDRRCHYLPPSAFKYENVVVHPLVQDGDWCAVGFRRK